jgi:hypothetical protein
MIKLLWWLIAAAALAIGATVAATFAVQTLQKLACSSDGHCDLKGTVAVVLFAALWLILFAAGSLALSDFRRGRRRRKRHPR